VSTASEHLKSARRLYRELRELEKKGRSKSAEYNKLVTLIKIEADAFSAAVDQLRHHSEGD
jgi:hypothetical protein